MTPEANNSIGAPAPHLGGWQSIETAPKDGTWVLAGWHFGGRWVYRLAAFDKRDYMQSWHEMPSRHMCPASHWMPLPEAPNVQNVQNVRPSRRPINWIEYPGIWAGEVWRAVPLLPCVIGIHRWRQAYGCSDWHCVRCLRNGPPTQRSEG